jgi:hypothetical protein
VESRSRWSSGSRRWPGRARRRAPERPTDILALRERIAQLTGPLVVDVLIDPDVRMPTRDRLVTMDSSKKRMN